MSENISLLSETTQAQWTAEFQANDKNIFGKITKDGAKTATDCIAPDDNRRIPPPPAKRKRGEEKSAFPERRSKQVSEQSGKAITTTPADEGAKNGSNISQTHKPSCTDKGRKTVCTSTSAKTVNMTQLLDILQSSRSTVFVGLTESMKTGFADFWKVIQETKTTEDKEISSQSEVLDN